MGFLVGQKGKMHTYQQITGEPFEVNNRDIKTLTQFPVSLMPTALHLQMPKPDLQALVFFLEGLK